MDAVIFAVHALFGLHVLHEQIGHVYGNIKPESGMFSVKDGIWKLTEFGSSMPLEESLKITHKCRTPNYISPETWKSEIYSKSTYVYALGKVLWNSFHVQLMWLSECGESTPKTRLAYDKLVEIIRQMTLTDPVERLTVMEAIRLMYKFVKDNQLKNFEIYGSSSILPIVECLL